MADMNELGFVLHADVTSKVLVTKVQTENVVTVSDNVAEEVPIALIYNGISHAVMLATPQDLEDFALGFSLAEGILDTPSDLYGLEIVVQPNGIELQLDIASACFARLKEKRRSMAGRTGCGLCGSESLEGALRMPTLEQLARLNHAYALPRINAQVLSQAVSNIRKQQALQALTGATHASAWVNVEGTVMVLREDVGRHNALDKLVGALKKTSHEQTGFILTTSRASYEMVQKTASAGVAMLVAISAPTGLAIRVAEHYGITLIGFARTQGFVVYCDPKSLVNLD